MLRGRLRRTRRQRQRAGDRETSEEPSHASSVHRLHKMELVSFLEQLPGAVVMAPMTKGSNLPYRRLCVELGAEITVSEMTLARRLKQKRSGEFALIRRFAGEPCFGVQLATIKPDEAAWAAALVEARGADFVDINFGCPIDYFTRKGLGAALGRQPNRIRRLVEAMKRAVTAIPVTAKIRLGWNDAVAQLPAAGAGGGRRRRRRALRARPHAQRALSLRRRLGRHRRDRRRRAACRSSATAICYFRTRSTRRGRASGCAAVMVARAALIKPWIFREATDGYRDITADERLAHLSPLRGAGARALGRRRARARRASARSSRGTSTSGAATCRVARTARIRRCSGAKRSSRTRSPLEALLARSDAPAFDYLSDRLPTNGQIDPGRRAARCAIVGADDRGPAAGPTALRSRADASAAHSLLELFERARPVVLEQPRQRPVGEQLAAGLARRDSSSPRSRRSGCAAPGCRRPGTACRSGRARPSPRETRHLLRKRVAGLRQSAARATSSACRRRRSVQARDLRVGHLRGQLHRRHPRGVQDLVRVGVADAAEQMRIGQRALDGVILAAQRARELLARRLQQLEAAGIVRGQPPLRRGRSRATPGASSRLRSAAACRWRNRTPRGRPCRESRQPRSFQRKRPAIIRWMTTKSSSSSSRRCACRAAAGRTMRRPTMASSGGSIERTRNGLAKRTRLERAGRRCAARARGGRARCRGVRALV